MSILNKSSVCAALVFSTLAWSQAVPKNAPGYPDMSSMGRLAQLSTQQRSHLAAAFSGKKGVVRSHDAGDPDHCLGGDEDCSEEGFTDGPGGGQAEVSVAVDVTGQHIVVGYNDTRGFNLTPNSLSGFAYSDDGGATFTVGGTLPTNAGTVPSGAVGATALPQVFGDPALGYIPGGSGCQFIYASIGVIGIGAGPAFASSAQTMVIHRSTDCGHTWAGPFEITTATRPHGISNDSADKEFIDVDPDTGRVIISWSNFTTAAASGFAGTVEIRSAYTDNVMSATPPTWTSSGVLNGTTGNTYFDTGSIPRCAGHGSTKCYVAYSSTLLTNGFNNIGFAVSSDNGQTWAPAVKLAPSDYLNPDYVIGNDRIHSFPGMAVDNSSGPNSGRIYVAAANNNNQDGSDIMLWKISSAGVVSPGILINARPGTDRSQWFPWVAVDSGTGRVHVMYDDQLPASSGDLMQMSWVSSSDGGASWSQPSALVRPFHAAYGNDTGQPNIGDYNGAVAQSGVLFTAFAAVPPVAFFDDGEPASVSFPYPTFLPTGFGAESYTGFAKVVIPNAALQLGAITFVDGGGNGNIDAGDQVKLTIPLINPTTNAILGAGTYGSVSGTISTTTPGVTLQRATSAYPNLAAGATANNSQDFVFTLAPNFTPGTKLDMVLSVTTATGNVSLPFILNTGTPVTTTLLSENFNGVTVPALPAGWTTSHGGGSNTVPFVTNSSFCSTGSNVLFHTNANDAANPTRFERAFSPIFAVPAGAQYVTLDMDLCYDTEDDPSFNVLAYDGLTLRITDQTAGHALRSVFLDAVQENLTTGGAAGLPKHAPRNSNPAYFQDISMWAGFSNGFKHVSMRLNAAPSDSLQLRFEFTQDGGGICSDVRPGHTCGVAVDNVVVNSVVTKSDELSKITLRPVPGVTGQWTGTVTSQPIAPAGGITINLTSSLPAQTTVPASVVIPAGSQTSPSFTVTLAAPAAGIPVTITATGPSNVRAAGIQR